MPNNQGFISTPNARTGCAIPSNDMKMRPDATQIQLHHREHRGTIEARDTYFAFASGRFDYDCVSCGAKCCHGFGFHASVGREVEVLIANRRSLPLFLASPSGEQPSVVLTHNYAPGCFFLSEDGRCGVHVEYGYDAKPETCRLFPFNNIRRIGRHLVVGPHSGLCPIQLTPPASTSSRSSHDVLLGEMALKGISGNVALCTTRFGDVSSAIDIERAIVAASEQFLDTSSYLEFALEQLRIESRMRSAIGNDGSSLLEMHHIVKEVLGEAAAEVEDKEVTQLMVAVTPVLRSLLVFQESAPARAARPVFADHSSRIPHAMLCLSLIATSAKAAGMRKITYQTVTKLEMDFRTLIRVLTRPDTVMVWQHEAHIDINGFERRDHRRRFLKIARALLPSNQKAQRVPLGLLLLEHSPPSILERLSFLQVASHFLAGRIAPLGDESVARPPRGISSRLQNSALRWFLDNADESAVLNTYERIADRRKKRLVTDQQEIATGER